MTHFLTHGESRPCRLTYTYVHGNTIGCKLTIVIFVLLRLYSSAGTSNHPIEIKKINLALYLPPIYSLGQEYIPSADLQNCHAPRQQSVFTAGRLAFRGASRSWYAIQHIISMLHLVVPLVRFRSVCWFGYSSHVSDVEHIP